jgi:hypothetical protein
MINTPRRDRGEPTWRGEQVETLRVWPEQGVGDEVLFARLVPLAAQRAQRVVLECDARLVSFYARSFAGVEVCAVDGDAPRADAQCSLGSLCAALRVGLIELDDGAAYLKADGSRVADIRARYEALAQGRPIIGVAWASKHPRRGAAKGAPIEEWGALLEREALFVNLQYGDVAGDVTRAEDLFGAAMHCDDTIDQMRDLDGFAAQIAALDHVVSISNTTVHIAGALGAPCILMAPPARGLLWYWGGAGEMTPWYRSVRIVRRALSASRSGQVADVARTLFP